MKKKYNTLAILTIIYLILNFLLVFGTAVHLFDHGRTLNILQFFLTSVNSIYPYFMLCVILITLFGKNDK